MNSNFKYVREDFKPRSLKLTHMEIELNFLDGKVYGKNILTLEVLESTSLVVFDCKVFKVQKIMIVNDCFFPSWTYNEDNADLSIELDRIYEVGETLRIETSTVCVPSDSMLEGIYKDVTYRGPQQYISQCQQWGFQRILPVFDDCTAKCTMRTTIEADVEYTHLISNGNVCRTMNPDGKPIILADTGRQRITYQLDIPMVPYLFIVAVGSWDVLEDEVVYKSGRKVRLEYLVPPGRKTGAEKPMNILKDSILWHGATQNYEYPFEVYRTICMEKSNWGGMENLGNTTIVTDAALIDDFTGDTRVEYAHAVIIHEFEHNQCGSEVTMETPFDIWLNEAFTVDVERQYMHSRFDSCWQRLSEVESMREPIGGPLAIEEGGQLGNIVREGFNDPDELIDGLTYVKSTEVIRMLKLFIGEDNFIAGKNLYFERYKGGNANSDQFLDCFEEISGVDLGQFKHQWLYTIGYPIVSTSYNYDESTGQLVLNVSQKHSKGGSSGFVFPLAFSVVDKKGKDVLTGILNISKSSETFKFEDVGSCTFISWNRDCCFYGVFEYTNVSREHLFLQAEFDSSLYNRVEAVQILTDTERIKLIKDVGAEISQDWLELYGRLIADCKVSDIVKSYMLNIGDQPLSREYIPYYIERVEAQEKLALAICIKHLGAMIALFNSIDTYNITGDNNIDIGRRKLKFVVLKMITNANAPKAYMLAEEHFKAAIDITDKLNALRCVNMSVHPDKESLLKEAYEKYGNSNSGYRQYITTVAQGSKNCLSLIKEEEQRDGFDMTHPGHVMGLYLAAVSNNRILWSDEGLNWVADRVVKLAKINEYFANRMIGCFRMTSKMKPELKKKVVTALEGVIKELDDDSYLAQTIKSFL